MTYLEQVQPSLVHVATEPVRANSGDLRDVKHSNDNERPLSIDNEQQHRTFDTWP
jgi:hypothetical protein